MTAPHSLTNLVASTTPSSNHQPPHDFILPELNNEQLSSTKSHINTALSPSERKKLIHLLRQYKDVFASNPEAPLMMKGIPPVHIDTGDSPPQHSQQYRRHSLAYRYINERVEKMLQQGLIEPSTSSSSFPVVLALKPNGTIRFCIDYRKLNLVTKQDAYTLPRLDDILDSMHGKAYFSTLDAASGFHQLPLGDSSKLKTAFSTKSGHYQWTRLPFGWINAPATFQRTMDFILRGLTFICALVYMDDIVIHSKTFGEHLEHLSLVLNRLQHYCCQLRLEKCHFAAYSLEYLGHVLSAKGIHTKPALVQAIQEFPSPNTCSTTAAAKSAVKSFVALANFYRRFVKNFALIADPLLALTRKRTPFSLSPSHQRAFDRLKSTITSAPVLAHPQWDKTFILSTDASTVGVGAVLEHLDDNSHERPIQFLSHAFNDRERKWSMPETEIFAFVYAIRKFRVYLYARPFRWRTDAAALKGLQTAKCLSPKLMRWALSISEYRFQTEHIPTKQNAVADALSRCPILSLSRIWSSSLPLQILSIPTYPALPNLPFTGHNFSAAQKLDPYCRVWFSRVSSSLQSPTLSPQSQRTFTEYYNYFNHPRYRRFTTRFILLDDLLFYILDQLSPRRALPPDQSNYIRPVVPHCFRTSVLNYFRNRSHRNASRTARDMPKISTGQSYMPIAVSSLHHDIHATVVMQDHTYEVYYIQVQHDLQHIGVN